MVIAWHKSTCSFCGLGCGLMVGVEKEKIVKVRGMKGHPTNDGTTCLFPPNYPPIFTDKDRLKQPMIRRDNQLVPVSWDEVIKYIASRFKKIIEDYGPNSIAFYGGAMNLTEEYYLINKLMKGAIGTNNVECSTRLCMASSAAGFISTLGVDAPPTCYADVEQADLFFIAGFNMAVTVPVLFQRLQATKKNKGAKIIVVDPRRTITSDIADIHLQIRSGTDVALNNTLAHILLNEGYVNEVSVDRYTSGLDDLKIHLEKFPPSKGAEITGCSEDQIVKVAHVIGESKAMLAFWFQGYNHSSQAMFKNNTLHNLLLLTGNFCRPGAGPLSITGESNALGNRWVGALSHLLPGMRLVSNYIHRQEVADFWNVPLDKIQPIPGKSILDIIKGLHSDDIRAFWIMTTNPAVSLPNSNWVRDGLVKTDLLVVQDIFHPTETTQLADVILPAAQWCEKEGTFISSERRIQLIEKLIEPPGEAKPDYEIIWLIAQEMGFEKLFGFNTPEEIFEEWKKFTKDRICDMNGVTYERLRGEYGLQLPCPDVKHPGTERLFIDWKFPRPDGRASLLARDYKEPAEKTDKDFPFVLITGRLANHFNSRTRTGRVPELNKIAPYGFVNIHPEDATYLDIMEGDTVEISSRRGSIHLPAQITDRNLKGELFIPWHYGSGLGIGENKQPNILTNNIYDIHSKQPEYKYSAVKITKII